MPATERDDQPVIAVDLGATTTRVALCGNWRGDNQKGLLLHAGHRKLPGDCYPSPGRSRSGGYFPGRGVLPRSPSGSSACGPIDHRWGSVVRPPNLPFREIPLAGPLGEEFGLPVRLANDCHAGVLGEVIFGAAGGRRNLVYITFSTGIGGGVICNGRLVLGREGNAAEIGHFHVDTTYNLPCGCGGTGHWEGYASGRFIPRFFARWCDLKGSDTR